MTPHLIDIATLGALPPAPGVYLMKDASGDVIYVGKAANIRNRVRSYFTQSGDNRFSVQFLRRQISNIECVVTANQKEAFLLENTLVKEHHPRFNVRLRDDKTYVSLRFRRSHDFPRLETARIRHNTRSRRDPHDLYFGPYLSSYAVRQTLRFLLRVFPV
ncbi:MAG: GIY-YIG nuclease family protein, partial [Candidatus Sumerlaeota bacterium]|nr:GIY-YIG nuclease family protein [Candidatus Sumerlaeota bacterium]